MRIQIGLVALLVGGVQLTGMGQTIRGTTSMRDWGIGALESIRFGEVSLFRDGGDWLSVGRLSTKLPAAPPSATSVRVPLTRGGVAWVAELIGEETNRLGGSFNVFERIPSGGLLRYIEEEPEGRRLRFEYAKKEDGYCGFWIQLYDAALPATARVYCDAAEFSTLLLWVRGERGGERVSIRLADREREGREYSLPAGMLGDFTPAGRISRSWQCARIPLNRFPAGLNRSELALLVLQADAEESSAIELRGVAFAADPESPHPLLVARESPAAASPREHGLWVWNTDSLLLDRTAQDQFLSFIATSGFTAIYLAIPYTEGGRSEPSIPIPADGLRPLLRRIHATGARTEALYGDKSFAERKRHSFLLTSVENLLRYNDSSQPEERFIGVHLDIEPYLLPGFMGSRGGVLSEEYLELLEKCKALCVRGSLRLSADIPFWYDGPDEVTGEELFPSGGNQDMVDAILERVDQLVVMDYRTRTFGLDGILRQSEGELERGEKRRRSVMIGLETSRLPVEELWIFRGAPMSKPEEGPMIAIAERGDGLEIRFIPGTGSGTGSGIGPGSGVERGKVGPLEGESWHYWRALRKAVVPPEKISFWTLGWKALAGTMEESLPFLTKSSAFRGFALHHYGSVKELK